jgi:hypothetical protein
LFVVAPMTIWAGAFCAWTFWPDITRSLGLGDESGGERVGSVPRAAPRGQDQTQTGKAKENITNEDRRKLEDLLQRR